VPPPPGPAPSPGQGPASPDLVELDGVVRRSLANDLFEVSLADGRQILAHLAPAARLSALRVGAGDRVRVALARYDHTRGRITGRAAGS
jgi:translation initiation factor IF-1